MNKSNIKLGMKSAIPVIAGYYPAAIAYGLLAKNHGLNFFETLSISVIVFAGASQFAAIQMIGLGLTPASIIFATFLMNFRHFLMSSSLQSKMQNINTKLLPIIAFFVTDETFAVATNKKGQLSSDYLLFMQIPCYLSWVAGSATGHLIGDFIPASFSDSMGMALYALFIAIIVPTAKKNKIFALLAISAGFINSIIIKTNIISSHWSIIVSVISISLIYTILKEKVHERI